MINIFCMMNVLASQNNYIYSKFQDNIHAELELTVYHVVYIRKQSTEENSVNGYIEKY